MKRPFEEPASAEITPPDVYVRRRALLKGAGVVSAAAALGGGLIALSGKRRTNAPPPRSPGGPEQLVPQVTGRYGVDLMKDAKSAFPDITGYNNYYELGPSKGDPSQFGHLIRPRPWTVRVEGEVEEPLTLDLDEIIGWFDLEERIYRMRCIEGWSLVIPWLGFPLAELIKRLEPTSQARFVEFTTLLDPKQLPQQTSDVLPWPYVEALRIDEATHPLSFMAIGLYGFKLRGQNGAPLRLVVPWKYGFKGAKSIVKIRFTREQPKTTRNSVTPGEYGFYGNVNPALAHPQWSQATEQRIGELTRRETLLFNGYAKEVASLYTGMDLAKYY
jgi:methionine sulfoxide reductase catalytic subunit